MAKKTNFKTYLVIVVFLLAMGPAVAAGGTIYVDADASTGGDGTTWGTAYKYLQDALDDAVADDEIWVAEGTYNPDDDDANHPNGSGLRTDTFQLINGVEIYGGFAGGESSLGERDWQTNETVLSGEIGAAGNSDNSYHVVTGSGTDATAILDGFTITAGNANGSNPYDRGGGMDNRSSSSPTVTNCSFSGNWADVGGGMDNDNSSPMVTNCTFKQNLSSAYGGGMCNVYGSNATVTNCTFSGNSGGGMYNSSGSPTVTNCTFSGNSGGVGGGMFNSGNSNPTVTDCTFSGNSASNYGGGGMSISNTSSLTLANCILWGDTASDGNEIALYSSSTIDVNYCDVKGGQTDIYKDVTSSVNWGTGNIDEDPLFINSNGLDGIPGTADDEEGYVHLRGYSPCINAGDPGGDYSGQVDLDRQPRVAYGRVDMGADEVYPIFGDSEPDGDVDFADFARFANNWLLGK